MKRTGMIVLAVLLGCQLTLSAEAGSERDFVAVFWNLENYFDYTDQGTGDSDREFSSFGTRRWTRKRFAAKSSDIARGIFYLAEQNGQFPDVIGLAEVENRNVLYKLLNDTNLRKTDYKFVHFESHDRRGIDVALLYRSSLYELCEKEAVVPLDAAQDTIFTRDILRVRLKEKASGLYWDVFVNHHPSKFGGAKESGRRRMDVMATMCRMCEKVLQGNDRLISMGDFNDTPDGEQFALIDGLLVNKADVLCERGEGTIRYDGRWELIDMFMTSPAIAEKSEMRICRIPFLMEADKKHTGEKPKRCYVGPRYNGGVSDHLPIVLTVSR